jgi:D-alanyl-D-alanine dipeptidase
MMTGCSKKKDIIFVTKRSENFKKSQIFMEDSCILNIPILENHECMVDLRQQSILKLDPSPEISDNQDYMYLRKTVYEKLVAAQKLLPKGVVFCIYEGYRSLKLQNMLFQTQYAILKREHPHWFHEKIFKECTRLVSPVINIDHSLNIPPHNTGAAFSIFLIKQKTGIVLPMGIHPKNWSLDTDGSLSKTKSKKISFMANKNRNIMNKALNAVGFSNYWKKYWHWSYGDRYHAYCKKLPYAIYGTVAPPYESLDSYNTDLISKKLHAVQAIQNISQYFTQK